jgi:hypothetical protein
VQGPQGLQGQQGLAGVDGQTGPQGLVGPQGGVRWADKTGAIVPGVFGEALAIAASTHLYYFDRFGHTWLIDPDTLVVSPVQPNLMYHVYTTTNCTGTSYYSPSQGPPFVPPRVTFGVQGFPGIRVRNDDGALLAHPGTCSTDSTGICTLTSPCPDNVDAAILESDTTVVTVPTVDATPPLHPVFGS